MELNLAYQSEGCGKTRMKINDTMPHTWIVWVHAQNVHSHIAIQEMSAIRLSLHSENFHILRLGRAKTLSYVRQAIRLTLQI